MDYFKSAIINREMLAETIGGWSDLSHDLIGNDPSVQDFEPDDELHIDTTAWGWSEGGLHRLLRNRECWANTPELPIYFRGPAMFSSFDDAKNEYLMDPMADCCGICGEDEQHVPFGMVIPCWHHDTEGGYVHLTSVTIILFWQEL